MAIRGGRPRRPGSRSRLRRGLGRAGTGRETACGGIEVVRLDDEVSDGAVGNEGACGGSLRRGAQGRTRARLKREWAAGRAGGRSARLPVPGGGGLPRRGHVHAVRRRQGQGRLGGAATSGLGPVGVEGDVDGLDGQDGGGPLQGVGTTTASWVATLGCAASSGGLRQGEPIDVHLVVVSILRSQCQSRVQGRGPVAMTASGHLSVEQGETCPLMQHSDLSPYWHQATVYSPYVHTVMVIITGCRDRASATEPALWKRSWNGKSDQRVHLSSPVMTRCANLEIR
ncbi:hypothetical protein DFJ69_2433 [Thermomonospora umbrina]|uniref:Uncharacterized protein n=1 Tax=Thermomonospora umbrina TaxID=111806 RepID=A0A3D9SM30_9ACTN|nr:hypothetical protein DFJ69_2433 [Thermomonospora umbrina]